MPNKKKLNIRLISASLIAAFLFQELAYAAPGISVSPAPTKTAELAGLIQNPAQFVTPMDFCALKEIHVGVGAGTAPLLIHIQDPHSNFSGQQNLAGALDQIITRYGVSTILVEGGEGDVSLTEVRNAISKNTLEQKAKTLLMDAQISGEEYLNLTTNHPIQIIGIENLALYAQSIKAYSKLAATRQEVLEYLKTIQSALQKAKNKIYPKELLNYEKDKDGNFETSFKRLLDLAEKAGLSLRAQRSNPALSTYPNLSKLKNLQAKEASLDFNLANLELASLVVELQKKGGQNLADYLAKKNEIYNDRMSLFGYFQNTLNSAREKGLTLKPYSNLIRYEEYLKEFTSIELSKLADEKAQFEEEVYQSVIASTAKQSRSENGIALSPSASRNDTLLIHAIDRYIHLLQTAYNIQMTNEEFRSFQANEPDFATVSYLAFLNKKLIETGYFEDLVSYKDLLETGSQALKDFYDSVDQRDLAFLKNIEKELSSPRRRGSEPQDSRLRGNDNAVVLITGGYHTEHLKELFQQSGYSYIVLTPKVTQETNQAKYEKVLLEPLEGLKPSEIQMASGKRENFETARALAEMYRSADEDWLPEITDRLVASRLAEQIKANHAKVSEAFQDRGVDSGARLSGTNTENQKLLLINSIPYEQLPTILEKQGVGKVVEWKVIYSRLQKEKDFQVILDDAAEKLSILERAAFKGRGDYSPQSAEAWGYDLEDKDHYLLIQPDGSLGGFIASSAVRGKPLEMDAIAVKVKRASHGSFLLDAFFKNLRDKKITNVTWVASKKSEISFYRVYLKERGFKIDKDYEEAAEKQGTGIQFLVSLNTLPGVKAAEKAGARMADESDEVKEIREAITKRGTLRDIFDRWKSTPHQDVYKIEDGLANLLYVVSELNYSLLTGNSLYLKSADLLEIRLEFRKYILNLELVVEEGYYPALSGKSRQLISGLEDRFQELLDTVQSQEREAISRFQDKTVASMIGEKKDNDKDLKVRLTSKAPQEREEARDELGEILYRATLLDLQRYVSLEMLNTLHEYLKSSYRVNKDAEIIANLVAELTTITSLLPDPFSLEESKIDFYRQLLLDKKYYNVGLSFFISSPLTLLRTNDCQALLQIAQNVKIEIDKRKQAVRILRRNLAYFRQVYPNGAPAELLEDAPRGILEKEVGRGLMRIMNTPFSETKLRRDLMADPDFESLVGFVLDNWEEYPVPWSRAAELASIQRRFLGSDAWDPLDLLRDLIAELNSEQIVPLQNEPESFLDRNDESFSMLEEPKDVLRKDGVAQRLYYAYCYARLMLEHPRFEKATDSNGPPITVEAYPPLASAIASFVATRIKEGVETFTGLHDELVRLSASAFDGRPNLTDGAIEAGLAKIQEQINPALAAKIKREAKEYARNASRQGLNDPSKPQFGSGARLAGPIVESSKQ